MFDPGRRNFITLLGGAALARPLAARAQPPTMPVVGYLGSTAPEMSVKRLAAFRKGLRDAGFEEGRNVAIDFRWAGAREERMPELVADLIRQRVAVIVAPATTAGALAAKAATTTIPIVFAAGTDPVALGLVTSLSRPGGNSPVSPSSAWSSPQSGSACCASWRRKPRASSRSLIPAR